MSPDRDPGAHQVARHFVVNSPGGLRDRASVAYLGDPAMVVESLFPVAVTWHAMLGVVTLGYGFWMIAVLAGG